MTVLRLSETNKAFLLKNGRVLVRWLGELSFFSEKRVQIALDMTNKSIIQLYSNDNVYRIKATNSYLGCTALKRKPRPGEEWNRGNDLPDGPFSKETFRAILGAIVCYELKEVVKPSKSKLVTPIEGPDRPADQ